MIAVVLPVDGGILPQDTTARRDRARLIAEELRPRLYALQSIVVNNDLPRSASPRQPGRVSHGARAKERRGVGGGEEDAGWVGRVV